MKGQSKIKTKIKTKTISGSIRVSTVVFGFNFVLILILFSPFVFCFSLPHKNSFLTALRCPIRAMPSDLRSYGLSVADLRFFCCAGPFFAHNLAGG